MTRPRRLALPFVLPFVLSGLLLAGCGSATTEDLSSAAASQLGRDADALATAARAKNYPATRNALATLRRDVATQLADGGVSAARAKTVLAAAAAVSADVPAPKPTPSPVATTRAPVVSDSNEDRGKGKGKDDEHGKDD